MAGRQVRAWDSRRFLRRTTYDELRRPTGLYITDPSGAERQVGRTVYGEGQGDAANHRNRVFQAFDDAGVATSVAYDFKGNLLESRRDLVPLSVQPTDWLQNPTANDGSFTTRTSYDALDRVVTSTGPDGSVYMPKFNEANLLDHVDVRLRGGTATSFVTNVDYNAKGQRTLIGYANGAQTIYEYDPLTFRLTKLKTTRAGPDATATQLFLTAAVVQDLRYTYDPVGNLTQVKDAALADVFYQNQKVEPVGRFTYDALYRLIEAQGREHIGQSVFDFAPPGANYRDYPFVGQPGPNDLQALRRYTERYEYDAAGNLERVRHTASGGSWTRSYEHAENSQLETNRKSNRLSGTVIDNGVNRTESYAYDEHGNTTAMPHLPSLSWDYADRLREVGLAGETVSCVYDAAGERVRKVVSSPAGTRRRERIYVGGFEVYREFAANGIAVQLERESLHVLDDKQRISLVETETVVGGNAVANPVPLQRHQLGNHLGSASVELADDGALISYEEYRPYGTTAFQAGRSAAETSLKRYRYIGKERDEETGLSFHGARYYATWLGRWVSADPAGVAGGINLFRYASGNPIRLLDRTGLADVDKQAQELKELGATASKGDTSAEYEANRLFSELTAGSLPKEYTPTTALEKSIDVDITTTAHDEAVVRIVNAAIDAAAAKARVRGETPSEYELLRNALFDFVTPLRSSSPELSQNLVLRDVDHFIVGRIQEWRRRIPFESEPPGPTKSEQTVYEGELAAERYDDLKTLSWELSFSASWLLNENLDEPNAPTFMDENNKPASARGGRFWAWLGGQHLLSRDKPEESARPEQLKLKLQDVQQARPEYQRHLEKREHIEALEDSAFSLGF